MVKTCIAMNNVLIDTCSMKGLKVHTFYITTKNEMGWAKYLMYIFPCIKMWVENCDKCTF